MIVRKLIVTDGRGEREVLLVGTIVVGRDPACQLNDLDPLLSRRHAEFVSSAKGVTIRDLNSRNGILVNGDKVPEHTLKSGDVIQVGHLHVRYIEEPVVKTLEDHTRSHATTDPDIEIPTMAPLVRPARKPAAPPPAPAKPQSAAAPAKAAAAPAPVKSAPAAAPAPSPAATAPTAAMPIVEDDPDATRAQVARPAAPARPAPSASPVDDPDATRGPGMLKAPIAVEDPDATRVSSPDETRAIARPRAAGIAAPRPVEARLIANASLIVTEASPSCQAVIGARPETLVGGQLSDAISRSLTFVATGDGPSTLTLSIARASSGKMITITFRAGQAENL